MNAAFLKKVFASTTFAEDYRKFLRKDQAAVEGIVHIK